LPDAERRGSEPTRAIGQRLARNRYPMRAGLHSADVAVGPRQDTSGACSCYARPTKGGRSPPQTSDNGQFEDQMFWNSDGDGSRRHLGRPVWGVACVLPLVSAEVRNTSAPGASPGRCRSGRPTPCLAAPG
jgi:hypothetical protein